MAAETNLTTSFVTAQSIDFVEQYGKQLTSLFKMLGVQRKMPMAAGTTIKTYKSSVTLDGTKVAKGDIIPLSQVKLEDGDPIELEFDKKRKAVAVEDVQKYGFEQAIARTDDLLLRELQKELRKSLFGQLAKGTGTAKGAGLQGALAQAWGKVQVTMQTAFGLSYIENFLGVNVVVLSSAIKKGKIYATARIAGYNGNHDASYMYKDYPAIIKAAELNG